jgi:hypothetical protein
MLPQFMSRKFTLFVASLSLAAVANAQEAQAPKPPAPSSVPLIFADPIDPPPAPERKKEDWTVLSVDKSGLDLNLAQGMVLQSWETPEFTRELIRVQWRASDPMDLYVILPHGVTKPHAILYLYDYMSDTDRFKDDGWCKRATANGFAAVGMVSALTGHRFHAPRPLKTWFVSELQESLATSTHDVQMILNYLENRGDLDVSKVGMLGQGSGASIAVLAASADSRIAVLDLVDPWGDWPVWLRDSQIIPEKERANYLQPEFLAKIANLDPITYIPQLKTQAVRIEYVPNEGGTPKSALEVIVASAPKSANVIVYKDAQEHYNAWKISGLSGWIQAELQKQLPPKQAPAMAIVASAAKQ